MISIYSTNPDQDTHQATLVLLGSDADLVLLYSLPFG